MMYHIKTFAYALAISVALLAIMAKLDEGSEASQYISSVGAY